MLSQIKHSQAKPKANQILASQMEATNKKQKQTKNQTKTNKQKTQTAQCSIDFQVPLSPWP